MHSPNAFAAPSHAFAGAARAGASLDGDADVAYSDEPPMRAPTAERPMELPAPQPKPCIMVDAIMPTNEPLDCWFCARAGGGAPPDRRGGGAERRRPILGYGGWATKSEGEEPRERMICGGWWPSRGEVFCVFGCAVAESNGRNICK